MAQQYSLRYAPGARLRRGLNETTKRLASFSVVRPNIDNVSPDIFINISLPFSAYSVTRRRKRQLFHVPFASAFSGCPTG